MKAIMTAARLPELLEDHDTIGEMKVGDTGWAVPWALTSYGPNGCYLSGTYSVRKSQLGTASMLIERTNEGYRVHIPTGYRFRQSDNMPFDSDVPVSQIDSVEIVKKDTNDYDNDREQA